MNRIVGIDYGRKRVGVALSDPLMMFASPKETIQTTNIIDYLKKLCIEDSIVRFVVGYPMNMDNTPSEAANDVDVFLKQLHKNFPNIPVSLEDERFTSVLAHRSLIESGVKKMDRRDKFAIDKVSAAIILQTFMDRKTQ
jgi:putative holliday junction resolvase